MLRRSFFKFAAGGLLAWQMRHFIPPPPEVEVKPKFFKFAKRPAHSPIVAGDMVFLNPDGTVSRAPALQKGADLICVGIAMDNKSKVKIKNGLGHGGIVDVKFA